MPVVRATPVAVCTQRGIRDEARVPMDIAPRYPSQPPAAMRISRTITAMASVMPTVGHQPCVSAAFAIRPGHDVTDHAQIGADARQLPRPAR